jgi:small subunit ribosomal protein S17
MASKGSRKTREGLVVGDKADKTVKVRVERLVCHPQYKKTVRRRKTYAVHDADNECHAGDRVRIVETRPLSKMKRWRVLEIVEKAK